MGKNTTDRALGPALAGRAAAASPSLENADILACRWSMVVVAAGTRSRADLKTGVSGAERAGMIAARNGAGRITTKSMSIIVEVTEGIGIDRGDLGRL